MRWEETQHEVGIDLERIAVMTGWSAGQYAPQKEKRYDVYLT